MITELKIRKHEVIERLNQFGVTEINGKPLELHRQSYLLYVLAKEQAMRGDNHEANFKLRRE